MAVPFIALTIPAYGPRAERPIFVNALRIREVSEVWVLREGFSGKPTPDDYNVIGTHITTGSGEDGSYVVAESYAEVTGAIRDALS